MIPSQKCKDQFTVANMALSEDDIRKMKFKKNS